MIHPALEPYVKAVQEHPGPRAAQMSIGERRLAYRQTAEAIRGEPEPVAEVVDGTLDLGDRVLATRLYKPFGDEDKALVLYFHGGSFSLGDLETHDALCRRLAADTKMRFLAVDYRLAPEHPFPAGLNDVVDAMRHLNEHWEDFASPQAELIVMGDSAGASLVAVAAVQTRHQDLGVAAQVLIYPTLGPENLTDSAHKYGVGYMLNLDDLRFDYEQYLGEWTDRTDPRISPLMSNDLSGAPPAIVLVAECDPLRDEGVAYAGLLEHFQVPVELLEAEGMLHGFLRMGGIVPEVLDIVDDLARHMHRFAETASS